MNNAAQEIAKSMVAIMTTDQLKLFVQFVQVVENDLDFLSDRITALEEERVPTTDKPDSKKKPRPVTRLKLVKADG